jgi:hypothetical protein
VDGAVRARTPSERHDAVGYTWWNCMNNAFHNPFDRSPKQKDAFGQDWQTFLKSYGIREKVIPSGEDRNG